MIIISLWRITVDLSKIRDGLLVAKSNQQRLLQEKEQLDKELTKAKYDLNIAEVTQKCCQEAAQYTLETISIKINKIVTNALQAVFPDPYEFCLAFNIQYGKIACDMYLLRDGKTYDLKTQNGDGCVDCVALALRIAVMCLDKRKLRRCLILDEPAGAVSVDYQPYVGALLEKLVEQLSLQVIMIASHGNNLQLTNAKVFNSKDFTDGAVI